MINLKHIILDYVAEAISEDDVKEAVEEILDGYDFKDLLSESDKLREAIYCEIGDAVEEVIDCYV